MYSTRIRDKEACLCIVDDIKTIDFTSLCTLSLDNTTSEYFITELPRYKGPSTPKLAQNDLIHVVSVISKEKIKVCAHTHEQMPNKDSQLYQAINKTFLS